MLLVWGIMTGFMGSAGDKTFRDTGLVLLDGRYIHMNYYDFDVFYYYRFR